MERRVGIRIEGDASGYTAATVQAEAATRKLDEAQKVAEVGMRRATATTGQYQQAMRMLPMQITDVTTSLASGMPAWMVAIQQGGQIRDIMGGIGNAARGVTSMLSLSTVAMGGTALALAAVALAAQQGHAEFEAYHRAIIMTGNAAGVTAGQLDQLASRAAAAAGGSQSSAAGVAAGLVGTGQVRSSVLDAATEASIQLQRSLGLEAEKTAQIFASLGREPLSASIKLNDQWNYLTLATYNQIKALEEQGKVAEAGRLAQDTFAKSAIQRAEDMEKRLGTLQKAWRDAGEAASKAWSFMLGVGRETTAEQQLAIQRERLNSLPLGDRARAAGEARVDALRETIKFQGQAATERARQAQAVKDKVKQDQRPAGPKAQPYGPMGPLEFDDIYPAANVAEILKSSPNGLPFGLGSQASGGAKLNDVYGDALFGNAGDLGSPGMGSARRAEIEGYDATDKALREAQSKRDAEARSQAEEWMQYRLKLEQDLLAKSQPVWEQMVASWGDANQRMKASFDDTVIGTIERGEEAFVRFAQTGKINTASLVDFIIQQSLRQGYREFISLGVRMFSDYAASNNNPNYDNRLQQTGRASGGPVGRGRRYMVGENGPEMLEMGGQDGWITSNENMKRGMGGSGGGLQVTIINQSGTAVQGSASRTAGGGIEVLLQAVKSSLADDINNGDGSVVAAMGNRFGLRSSFSSA